MAARSAPSPSAGEAFVQLNESTLWSGDGGDHFNPKAHDAFVASRKLLLESKGTDATKITEAEKIAAE